MERQLKARAQIGTAPDGGQPFPGVAAEKRVPGDQHVGVGLIFPASHPPPELMELPQPETVRPFDDDGVGVGHVEAGFDDGAADQTVDPVLQKIAHHLFQLVFGHLAVGGGEAAVRHEFAELLQGRVDGFDPVVQIINLPAPGQFGTDRLGHQRRVFRSDDRLDREPQFWRRHQCGEIPRPRHGQVEGPGNGRGRHGQHVRFGPVAAQTLLELDPETLFLVDDHQPQIPEDDPAAAEPVGADDDVRAARTETFDGPLLLRGGPEAAEQVDGVGIFCEAFRKTGEMLLGEDRRGGDDRHLIPRRHRPERRPHGQLRLAVAHVAAEQPVHRFGRGQVGADFRSPPFLVGGVLKGEIPDELFFLFPVGKHPDPRDGLAHGLKPEHVRGVGADARSRFQTLLLPPRGVGRVEFDMGDGPHVAAELVGLGEGHVDLLVVLVFHDEDFAGAAAVFEDLEAPEDADAVIDMDDEIPLVDVGEADFRLEGGGGELLFRSIVGAEVLPLPLEARFEKFLFGHDEEFFLRHFEAGAERRGVEFDPRSREVPVGAPHLEMFHILRCGGAHEDHPAAAPDQSDLLLEFVETEEFALLTAAAHSRGVAFEDGENVRHGELLRRLIRGDIEERPFPILFPALQRKAVETGQFPFGSVTAQCLPGVVRKDVDQKIIPVFEVGDDVGLRFPARGYPGAADQPVEVDLARRTLGLGRETPHGVDLVAEILDAAGEFVGGTVEIDDAAPPGKFAGDRGLVFVVVIQQQQFFHQLFRRQFHTRTQVDPGRGAFLRQRRRTGEGAGAARQDVVVPREHLIQCPGPAVFRPGKAQFAPLGLGQVRDLEFQPQHVGALRQGRVQCIRPGAGGADDRAPASGTQMGAQHRQYGQFRLHRHGRKTAPFRLF